MNSGIYTITCLVNNKIYLGYTKDFEEREDQHFIRLRLGKHINIHLQRAFNFYKEENFIFEVFDEQPEHLLIAMEHYWGNILNVHDDRFGYNIKPMHPYNTNVITKEMRLKGDLKRKGQKRTDQVWVGRKHREESKEKMRIAKLGTNRCGLSGQKTYSSKPKHNKIAPIRKRNYKNNYGFYNIINSLCNPMEV